jgi:chromosome segregation ATPase
VDGNPKLQNPTRTLVNHQDRILEDHLRQMLQIRRLENEVTQRTMEQKALAEELFREHCRIGTLNANITKAEQRMLDMQSERDAWRADMTEAVQSMFDLRKERHVYKAAIKGVIEENLDLQAERDGLKVELAEAAQGMFDIQNEPHGLRTKLAAIKEIERQTRRVREPAPRQDCPNT